MHVPLVEDPCPVRAWGEAREWKLFLLLVMCIVHDIRSNIIYVYMSYHIRGERVGAVQEEQCRI